jgi:hypothetical protein
MTAEEWISQATDYFVEEWGLNEGFARKISQLYLWGLLSGFPMGITSGFRDPEKQRAMQARWDAGDRSGMVARPATNSKHSTTTLWGNPDAMAIDLYAGSDRNLSILGQWAENYLGLRWGGTFKNADLVHFYI